MTLSWSLGLGSLGRRLSSAWPAFGSSQNMRFNILLQAWSQKTLSLICICVHIYNHIFIYKQDVLWLHIKPSNLLIFDSTRTPLSQKHAKVQDRHSFFASKLWVPNKDPSTWRISWFWCGEEHRGNNFFFKEPPHLLGKPVYASSLSTLSNRMGHGCKLASAMAWM